MYKSLSFFIVFILIVSLTVSVIAEDKSKGVKFFKEIKVWTSFQAQNTGDQMKNLTDPTYHLLKNCPVYRDLLPYNANLGLSLTIIKSNNWGINIKLGTKSFMSSANGLFNYKPLFQSYSK